MIGELDGSVRGKKVGILGLTFKPMTDDMRDSPAIAIVQALIDGGAIVTGYDPEGMENAKDLIPGMAFAGGPYEEAEGAEAVVIVTEWNAFRALDLGRMET